MFALLCVSGFVTLLRVSILASLFRVSILATLCWFLYSQLASCESPRIFGQHQQPHWLVLRRSRNEPFSITSYGEPLSQEMLGQESVWDLTCRRTVTVLTACFNTSCPSQIWSPISSSEESLVPFLRRSPRPSSVRLVFQTQNDIPKIRNGQVPRYTGIGYFLSHLQRAGRGLLASQLHELHPVFSDASLQFVLEGFDQNYVPDYSQKQDFGMFFAVNMASGGVSVAGSLSIVYHLDYARTRLSSDVGSRRNLRRFVRLS